MDMKTVERKEEEEMDATDELNDELELLKIMQEGSDVLYRDHESELLDSLLAETMAPTRFEDQTGLSSPSVRSSSRCAKSLSLISTHRTVMTEMLAMVKDEMTLVNKADGDRDNVDDYLLELEKIHEKQISLMTTLHEVGPSFCKGCLLHISSSLLSLFGSDFTETARVPRNAG
jgi:hypothetical protein